MPDKKSSSMNMAIHQLNEQLQIIRSSVEHLAMVLDLSEEEHIFLDNIVTAVDNIAKISKYEIEQNNKEIKLDTKDVSKKLGALILIIEDEKELLELYKYNLEMLGFKVFSAENFIDGMSILDKDAIDIVILDIMLPDAYGLDCIDAIMSRNKDIKIIVTTGKIDELKQDLTYLKDKCVILTKPFSIRELLAAIL